MASESPFANLGLNFVNWSSVPSITEAMSSPTKSIGSKALGSAILSMLPGNSVGQQLQGAEIPPVMAQRAPVVPGQSQMPQAMPQPMQQAPAPMPQQGISQQIPTTPQGYMEQQHPLLNSAMRLLGLSQ